MVNINRRNFIKFGSALGVATAIAPSSVFAIGKIEKVSYATLKTGVSVIFNEFLKEKRPDLDNGLDINIVDEYTSVSGYYNDFISGAFELGIGSWDTYLKMYRMGVPVQMATSITTGSMINIVTHENGPSSIEELKGKTIAGIVASGAFNICAGVIKEVYGLELGKDIYVQNVPSPAQAMTLLMSGNVDAALSWEPNISSAMGRVPGMRVIYNLGESYEKSAGVFMPYFSLALHKDAVKRNSSIARKVHNTFASINAQINNNPMEAFEIAAPHLSVKPEVLMDAYNAGRLQFKSTSMSNASDGPALVRKVNRFALSDNAEIDNDFFSL